MATFTAGNRESGKAEQSDERETSEFIHVLERVPVRETNVDSTDLGGMVDSTDLGGMVDQDPQHERVALGQRIEDGLKKDVVLCGVIELRLCLRHVARGARAGDGRWSRIDPLTAGALEVGSASATDSTRSPACPRKRGEPVRTAPDSRCRGRMGGQARLHSTSVITKF